MEHVEKTERVLRHVIQQEAKVTVFSMPWKKRATYASLFSKDAQDNFTGLQVDALSDLLHSKKVIKDNSAATEKAVCEAYENYRTLSPWKKFLARVNDSDIAIYRHLYRIITLRNYHNDYQGALTKVRQGETGLFSTMLSTVTHYFSSYLPTLGFFARWFQTPKVFVNYAMQDQRKALKVTMEQEYKQLLLALSQAQSGQSLQTAIAKAQHWIAETKLTFQKNTNAESEVLDAQFVNMGNSLNALITYKNGKSKAVTLTDAKQTQIQEPYQALAKDWERLKEGCAVYIDVPNKSKMPLAPFSYVLNQHPKGEYFLAHYGRNAKGYAIPTHEVAGLDALLQIKPLDEAQIRTCILNYHAKKGIFPKNPSEREAALPDLVPQPCTVTLFDALSKKVLEKAANNKDLDPLFAEGDYIVEQHQAAEASYNRLDKQLQVEKRAFEAALQAIKTHIEDFKKACIEEALREPDVTLRKQNLRASLSADKKALQLPVALTQEDAYQQLRPSIQTQIAKAFIREKKTLVPWLEVLLKISTHSPSGWEGFSSFFGEAKSPEYANNQQALQDCITNGMQLQQNQQTIEDALNKKAAELVFSAMQREPNTLNILQKTFAEVLEEKEVRTRKLSRLLPSQSSSSTVITIATSRKDAVPSAVGVQTTQIPMGVTSAPATVPVVTTAPVQPTIPVINNIPPQSTVPVTTITTTTTTTPLPQAAPSVVPAAPIKLANKATSSQAQSAALPLPQQETPSAWEAWYQATLRHPLLFSSAIKEVRALIAKPEKDSKIDGLHYEYLCKLVFAWVQAARWLDIEKGSSLSDNIEDAKRFLKCKELYIRAHTDKGNDDIEIMKFINVTSGKYILDAYDEIIHHKPAPGWVKAYWKQEGLTGTDIDNREMSILHQELKIDIKEMQAKRRQERKENKKQMQELEEKQARILADLKVLKAENRAIYEESARCQDENIKFLEEIIAKEDARYKEREETERKKDTELQERFETMFKSLEAVEKEMAQPTRPKKRSTRTTTTTTTPYTPDRMFPAEEIAKEENSTSSEDNQDSTMTYS